MRLEDIHGRILIQPMRGVQILVVALCVLVNMLDGFDILAASLVAPILARDWSLSADRLGILLSAGPLGMAVGAFTLSWVADVFGRRSSMIMCLAFMSAGMLLSATADNLTTLIVLRFLTGLGVGTMASCTGVLVFEYANLRNRNLGLGLVTLGYPLGVIIGGGVSAGLIQLFGWPAVFVVGGLSSAALIPVALLTLPESLDFLAAREPSGALDKINRILARLGLPALEQLPEHAPGSSDPKGNLLDLFRPPVLERTLLMSFAYLFYMTSSYFILNWATKLTTDAGFSDLQGLSISILINAGGIVGGAAIGLLSIKLPFKPLSFLTMVAMGAAIAAFGVFANSLALIAVLSICIGFGIFGAALVLYATAARTFPAPVRATGIGMSMSAGRIGSIIGPAAAGFLLEAALGRALVCLILAAPVIIAIGFIAKVPLDPPAGSLSD